MTPPQDSVSDVERLRAAAWPDLKLPYTITHSPRTLHEDEAWHLNAMDAGYGLTRHSTRADAEARAEQLFGPEPYCTFTIKLCANRTQVKVAAAKGTVPADALNAAIRALQAEQADLTGCPVHDAGAPTSLRLARQELIAFANLVERPPLDDVKIGQNVALRITAAIRTVEAALAVPINKIGEDARTYADGVEDSAKVAETAVTYVVGEKRDLCDSIATAIRRLSTSTDKGVSDGR